MLTALKTLLYIILAILGLVICFFVGLILLVRKKKKKPLAEYANSQLPKKLMIAGTVLLSIPLVTIAALAVTGIFSSAKTLYDRSNYDCIPDIWRKESVSQSSAEEEILKALLVTADNGNREAFAMNFTPEMQEKKGFDKAIDNFFNAYPGDLSECKKNNITRNDSSVNENDSIKTDGLYFRCDVEQDNYFIIVEYCYFNKKDPDKVGVTQFRVMNLKAAAVYYENESANPADQYPICDIETSSRIDARLIGGAPYIWTPTDTPDISATQLRVLLKDEGRLDSRLLYDRLGEPNVGIKQPDSTEYGYFYEIAPENGEPRYVYFQTDSEFGNILWAMLCTPYEVDYDHLLYNQQ